MTEPRKLFIPGPAGQLECMLRVANAPRATVVLAHPHPNYGGTLHNPVVFHSDRDLHREGMTTLRFNFRGAGHSSGVHDEGLGEVEDLATAASWVRGLAPTVPLIAVGYSFGAWCAVRCVPIRPEIQGIVAIGLPPRALPFEDLETLGRPFWVVQGSDDEFGSPEEVRALLRPMAPEGKLLVVPGATHLFPGCARKAAHRVVEAAQECLAQIQPAPTAP